MKLNYRIAIILLIILTIITSCNQILKNIFGFKKIREFNMAEYDSFIAEINKECFNINYSICDSANFINISRNGLSQKYKSYMLQPMKTYLFENQELKFFITNCLVPPKHFNLNWNYNNKFNQFPPINSIDIDSLNLNLSSFGGVLQDNIGIYKYYYIVDWTLMTKRQSRLLIDQIYSNIDHFDKRDSTLIIINNIDDFYIKTEIEF